MQRNTFLIYYFKSSNEIFIETASSVAVSIVCTQCANIAAEMGQLVFWHRDDVNFFYFVADLSSLLFHFFNANLFVAASTT